MNINFRDFIINFLMGGGLIAGCGLISQIYSSSLSGMIYSSIPLGLIYLYLFILFKKGRKESGKYALFSIIGGIIWVFIAVLLYYFNNFSVPLNMFLSILIYTILVVVVFYIFNNRLNHSYK